MTRWAILTGEYPPKPGGVSDYTRLVAEALAAAGDVVTVYTPPGGSLPSCHGVNVVRLPDHFGPRGLLTLDHVLGQRPRPDRILVQYVPHAFGWKAMNLPFAFWVACRARRHAPVWVMFHEVAFPWLLWPPSHTLLGGVTRATARLLLGAAERMFVSIPAWGELTRRLCPRSPAAEWLPVPCNVGTAAEPSVIAGVREKHAPTAGTVLIGHFGTFGSLITTILESTVRTILSTHPQVRFLLAGRGSDRFTEVFAARYPTLASRVSASGELPSDDIPAHLRACDVLLQPYPDGVSSRRGSVMAGLANGVPVVTNLGALSENIWIHGAVALAAAPDTHAIAGQVTALLADEAARTNTGNAGLALYRDSFSLTHTIRKLRERGT